MSCVLYVFFFKQKTAYEMRISDWSSDVCSSDLLEDVRAFQVHLVSTGISWPALNQTVCALRFLYGVTLGHSEIPERIPYAREPRKLPVVLSADEVVRFLEAVPRSEEHTSELPSLMRISYAVFCLKKKKNQRI